MIIETKYNIGQTVTLPDGNEAIITSIETWSENNADHIVRYYFEDYFDFIYEEELT